jgi:hypothetical protein
MDALNPSMVLPWSCRSQPRKGTTMRHTRRHAGTTLLMIALAVIAIAARPTAGGASSADESAAAAVTHRPPPRCSGVPADQNPAVRAHPACRVRTTGARPHTMRVPA